MAAVAMKIACMVAASVSVTEGISCNDITPKLTSCIAFLRSGGDPSGPCCNGFRSANNIAKTTPDRKIACNCLKQAAGAFRVNPAFAAQLPGICDVQIPYAISPNTNCSKIR